MKYSVLSCSFSLFMESNEGTVQTESLYICIFISVNGL